MTRPNNRATLERRFVLGALAALPAASLSPAASAQATVRPTPRQSLGPFYPRNAGERPRDTDADLLTTADGRIVTLGTPLYLTGRILDAKGAALPNAAIEIWQCDANAVYHHPAGGAEAQRDRGFQGYGTARSATDGTYHFRTILPVAYPGRTPHIHVRVVASNGAGLATQLYLAGDPGNERDALYRHLEAGERAAITLQPSATSSDHPLARLTRVTMRADLVLA